MSNSIPRHLAPTVGQETAAGVTFCTGSRGRLGERVATGLIITFGSIDFIADNATCFAGSVFPEVDNVISFVEHRVYVAVTPKYPAKVQACSDHFIDAAGCEGSPTLHAYVKVMVSLLPRPSTRKAASATTL